jgi:hypothetical protein
MGLFVVIILKFFMLMFGEKERKGINVKGKKGKQKQKKNCNTKLR